MIADWIRKLLKAVFEAAGYDPEADLKEKR